jgi:hypothetical protein
LLDATAALPPSSSPSTLSSSSATPRSPPLSPYNTQPESEGSGLLDLLEPSPSRAPPPSTLDIFGTPMKQPSRKISGIFEVLGNAD